MQSIGGAYKTMTDEQLQAEAADLEHQIKNNALGRERKTQVLEYIRLLQEQRRAKADANREDSKKPPAGDPVAAARAEQAASEARAKAADAARRGREASERAAETERKAIANLKIEYDNLLEPMTNVQMLRAKLAYNLVDEKDATYQLQLSIAKLKDEMNAAKEARDRYLATFNYEEQVRRETQDADAARRAAESAEFARFKEQFGNERIAAMQRVNDQIDQLNRYMMEGKLTAEEYFDALENIQKGWPSMEKNIEEMKSFKESMRELAVSGIQGLTDAFFQAEQGFKNFAKSFLTQIAKMIAQQLLLRSLSGTSFGNFLGIPKFAKGGAFGGATGLPWGVYDKPTFFPMPGNGPLTKFAKGGVLGEAGYPEAILPLRRGAGGRLGVEAQAPVVNIYNNAPVQVRTEQEQDGSLAVYIEQIKNAIARDIRSGAGAVTSAMQGTYGLNRAAGAR